jgi:hypothetical protein
LVKPAENGCAVAEDDVDEALKDIERAVYLKRYLTEVSGLRDERFKGLGLKGLWLRGLSVHWLALHRVPAGRPLPA